MNPIVCKYCMSYMLIHQTLPGWRKCPNCAYCVKVKKEGLMSITMQELNPHKYATTPEIESNLAVLLDKINKVRTAYAIPMTVTSGLRSQEDQQRINPKVTKSHHLAGEAVDISDSDRKLTNWVKANMTLMEQIGLWFEDFDHTPTWVHFQIVPPKSGNRVFIP